MANLAGSGPSLPEDLVFNEILMRLPAKPLLRCRAVCPSWRRRLTSDTTFLLAHHRRQPSLPLVSIGDRSTEEARIDALDHCAGERRPVARTTGRSREGHLKVLASCDGLLILLVEHRRLICNPATRQRAPLTLPRGVSISALYPHRPSGSYRVLCCSNRAEDGYAGYHVYTLGSGDLRCVGEPHALWSSRDMPMFHPPVVVDGRIYWHPVNLLHGNNKGNNMLVFDTMAESFQHLLSPVEGPACVHLFEMSNGALGLYHNHDGMADLWVLQDHKSWTWSLNNRIELPENVFSVMPVQDPEGDLLVLSIKGGLQHISGANGSLLARYQWSGSLKIQRHMFRESIVNHDFFLMDGHDGGVDEKPLFDGLSTVALVHDDNSKLH